MKNGRYFNFEDICDWNLWDTGYLVKKLQGYGILRPPLMGSLFSNANRIVSSDHRSGLTCLWHRCSRCELCHYSSDSSRSSFFPRNVQDFGSPKLIFNPRAFLFVLESWAQRRWLTSHKYDFRPKLHYPKFNCHFIRSILKSHNFVVHFPAMWLVSLKKP